MSYRLIALDVDGTLLNDGYQIPDRTKRAVKQAAEQGADIVLCTGRGPAGAIPILRELGLEGCAVTHNGAATVRSDTGEVMHEKAFRLEDVQSAIEYCRQSGIHFDVNTVFELYLESCGEAESAMYEKYGITPVPVVSFQEIGEPLVKFTVFAEKDRLDRVEEDWKQLKLPDWLSWIRSGDYFIDIMHRDASKGNALRHLADTLRIEREAIMAIGNYYNDMTMLEFAGLGIAVENSPQAVKNAADALTSSNNEDGVGAAIEKYVLGHAEKH